MDKEREETLNCLPFGNGNDVMINDFIGRFCDTQEISPLSSSSLHSFSESFPIRFPFPGQFGYNQVLGTTQESNNNKSSLLNLDSDRAKTKPNSRKRKSKESPASSSVTVSNSKILEKESANVAGKRRKQNETEKSDNKDNENPHKDYIHVRARRGQATDSHSIAERARREKISERMKLLQDLVPGCNKVTGKAVMLDEIINYVQSLQRQVEFLSMKLATINPQMEFNANAILSTEMLQLGESLTQSISCSEPGLPSGYFTLGKSIPRVSEIQTQFQLNSSSTTLPSSDGFVQAEVSAFWENDLQSIVQMGFRDSQQHSNNCSEPTFQMKLEPER